MIKEPGLLTLLESATAADLTDVRERIMTQRKALDGLEALEKLLDVKLNGKKPRAKPGTKKKAPGCGDRKPVRGQFLSDGQADTADAGAAAHDAAEG